MPHHERRMLGAIRLPAAAGQDLASGCDLEKPRFIARAVAHAKAPGPEIGSNSLGVTLF